MTDERALHESVVDEWMVRANGSSSARLLDLFETSLRVMYRRARPTLGDRALGAVVGRVLYTASELFPFLVALRVERWGIRFDALRGDVDAITSAEFHRAIRFVMTELLEVLGYLTAGILTPTLHAGLLTARVGGNYLRSGK